MSAAAYPATRNSKRRKFFAAAVGLAMLALPLSAGAQIAQVVRAQNGLPTTDSLVGGFTIGLRGNAVGGGVVRQAWIGIWEADSDVRRVNGVPVVVQNGINIAHPALLSQFFQAPGLGRIDAAPDADPQDQNGHGTAVAGITLSADATNTGMASSAHGTGGMFDDIAAAFFGAPSRAALNPNTAGDWAQVKTSGDFLVSAPSNVINGSWGFSIKPAAANPNLSTPIVQADLDGTAYPTRLVDRYAFGSDISMVMAAGNFGVGGGQANNNLLGIPADNFNGINVGNLAGPGLGVHTSSSRAALAAGRNGVQIVAGGTNVTSANWNFATAGQGSFTKTIGGNPITGTSFAAPIVSGAAGILWSAGKQAIDNGSKTDKNTVFKNDHRLTKSVLLNSANHIPGFVQGGGAPPTWTPGATADATHWTHPLNYIVGAGELDANEAWQQYREKDNGNLHRWWHEDSFTPSLTSIGYRTDTFAKFTVPANGHITSLTATLDWDRHIDNALAATALSNLDLQFEYSTNNGANWTLILASVSPNDSVEHLYIPTNDTLLSTVPDGALYRLLISNAGLGGGINSEPYALSVKYVAVPEPGMIGIAMLWIAPAVLRRRRMPAAA